MKISFRALLAGGLLAVLCQGATDPLAAVDPLIDEAVQSHLIPGAVLLVGHNNEIVYRKAYGLKAWLPEHEPMTLDTIFDAASLTKVIATTPSVMRLFEEGKLRIDDPVVKYLPEFQGGKSDITIRLLMTHFSGLPPDLELVPKWSGYQTGIDKALTTKPTGPPGVHFVYSDINFILMGEIVRRLSGQSLAEFAHDQIYAPLGMHDTEFLPSPALLSRIAPTEYEEENGMPFRGVVHDPTSRFMGGMAGHAGVFTTADDLAKYAQMLVNMGTFNDTRLFLPETVRKFTEPGSPADQPVLRGLGWDIDSPFSSNRGELFPIGSYGHTGFTGTSLWIDPNSHSFVIFLTNVVHLKRGNSLSSLRGRLATAIAASFGMTIPQDVAITGYRDTIAGAGAYRVIERNADTLTGLDVLEAGGFRELKGKRVGLITNQTGLDRAAHRNVDAMLGAGRSCHHDLLARAWIERDAGYRHRRHERSANGHSGGQLVSAESADDLRLRRWRIWMRWCSTFKTLAHGFTLTHARCFTRWKKQDRRRSLSMCWTVRIRLRERTLKVRCSIKTWNLSSAATICRCAMA